MATDEELIRTFIPLLEMIIEDKQRISDITKLLALNLPGLLEAERQQLLAGSEISLASVQTVQALLNQLQSRL